MTQRRRHPSQESATPSICQGNIKRPETNKKYESEKAMSNKEINTCSATSRATLGSLKSGTVKERVTTFIQRKMNIAFQKLSLESVTRFLYRPCDSASLAATRIMFGILMALDVIQERGMGVADMKWGDSTKCRFPLLDALSPLPLPYMVLLYAVMFLCTIMMALGLKWRASSFIFVVSYWYIFLLDKSSWNNHSYLYGLLSTMLLLSDPHRCWSIDGIFNPKIRESHVPFWSYFLLRTQVFLLYFLAGIKKLDPDWLFGYSMQNLSEHWVFSVFRSLLSNEAIDYYIIHLGGFTLDLTIGFFLLCDSTRKHALFFGSAFHLMNSQIFSIGMFPWVCMATLPIFCNLSWPRPILKSVIKLIRFPANCCTVLRVYSRRYLGKRDEADTNWSQISRAEKMRLFALKKSDKPFPLCEESVSVCRNDAGVQQNEESSFSDKDEAGIDKEETEGEMRQETETEVRKSDVSNPMGHVRRNPTCIYPDGDQKVTTKQKLTTLAVVVYLSVQLFLPFSHFITKGYNTWTEGPYGYSWDMMVHSWDTLHVKITAVKLDTGKKFYIDPNVWSNSGRWTSHVDMAVQYGRCIENRLRGHGLTNISLHFDVWRSLNKRFQQRVYDPSVDVLRAPWSPWTKTSWVLPVLVELSQWRDKLRELQEKQNLPYSDRIFVADFPGMVLENFLSKDIANVTLEVLQGEVRVLLPDVELNSEAEQTESKIDIHDMGEENLPVTEINSTAEALHHLCYHNSAKESPAGYSECFPRDSDGTQELNVQSKILRSGESLNLPSGTFHSVITISEAPSSYMYTFINTTIQKIYHDKVESGDGDKQQKEGCSNHKDITQVKSKTEGGDSASEDENARDRDCGIQSYSPQAETKDMVCGPPTVLDFVKFLKLKLATFSRSVRLLRDAFWYIFKGVPMETKG